MTKTGPLSKAEKFFIEQKYSEIGLQGLCKELDRAKRIVDKHVKANGLVEEKPEKQKPLLAQQIAHHKGSTVMTENASTMSDDLRGRLPSGQSRRNCITKIRDNE